MFESAFHLTFAKPMPANVLALVKAQWPEACQEVLGEDLPAFKDFTKSVPPDANMPCLTVEWKRVTKITNSDGFMVGSIAEFLIAIADEDADSDVLIDRLFDRARVVDSIVRTAADIGSEDRASLLDGIPAEVRGLVDVDISEWTPGRNVPTGQRNLRAVGGTLSVSLTEV